MLLTITSIKLKSPFQLFSLISNSKKVLQGLNEFNCKGVKTSGIWTSHYTMTLWESEEEKKSFAKNGHHLYAMKLSSEIAKEIRVLTIDSETLIDWKTAKKLLVSKGKLLHF